MFKFLKKKTIWYFVPSLKGKYGIILEDSNEKLKFVHGFSTNVFSNAVPKLEAVTQTRALIARTKKKKSICMALQFQLELPLAWKADLKGLVRDAFMVGGKLRKIKRKRL